MISLEKFKEVLAAGYAANQANILLPSWENGRAVGRERSEILDGVFCSFLDDIIAEFKPDYQFFVAAIGGWGRQEVFPNSDMDLILVHESGVPPMDPFLEGYRTQLINFLDALHYISPEYNIYPIDELGDVDVHTKTAVLDLRILRGDHALAKNVTQALFCEKNPFEYMLRKLQDFHTEHQKYKEGLHQVPFSIKYGPGCLRDIQTALWLECFEREVPLVELYAALPPEVFSAMEYLFKVRALTNYMHGIQAENFENIPFIGSSKNEELTSDFLKQLDSFLGNDSRAHLLETRRCISSFAQRQIRRRLGKGVLVSENIAYGIDGLHAVLRSDADKDNQTFYGLMHASQKYQLPVSQETVDLFLSETRHFVISHPAFLELLNSPGIISPTLETMLECGALGKVIPGFSSLETACYADTHRHRDITRARQAVYRLQNLDTLENHVNEEQDAQTRFFREEYQKLDRHEKFILRLGLLCKGIPQELGVSSEHYVQEMQRESYPALAASVASCIKYLIDSKGVLLEATQSATVIDGKFLEKLTETVKDEQHARLLLLFTYADMDYAHPANGNANGNGTGRKSESISTTQWSNIIHIYTQLMKLFSGEPSFLVDVTELGEAREQIFKTLPPKFVHSRYHEPLPTHLRDIQRVHARLLQDEKQYSLVNISPRSYADETYLVKVICKDTPGLVQRMAALFYTEGLNIQHAEIYSLPSPYGIAFDLFELQPTHGRTSQERFNPDTLSQRLTEALFHEPAVPQKPDSILRKARPDYTHDYLPEASLHRLTVAAKDQRGLLWAILTSLSEALPVDIDSLSTYVHRDGKIYDIIFFRTGTNPLEVPTALQRMYPAVR